MVSDRPEVPPMADDQVMTATAPRPQQQMFREGSHFPPRYNNYVTQWFLSSCPFNRQCRCFSSCCQLLDRNTCCLTLSSGCCGAILLLAAIVSSIEASVPVALCAAGGCLCGSSLLGCALNCACYYFLFTMIL
jgi:hypothetical protein